VCRRNFQTVHRSLLRDRSLLKAAGECVAAFYALALLLLLLRLFVDTRRVGTSALEQEDNEEKK
jgi:hypothetical protein